ncbi:MAG TPA: ZIP family zinc transporter [Microbacteriaceae bacterium]|nr:ZIP family zinc transporter [Microbacteriaceae bacterium]
MTDIGGAALAGLAAGGALVLGAILAWTINVPRLVTTSVMAFGSGVLISALSFDLVLEAQQEGGLLATAAGFAAGALAYVLANRALDRANARNPRHLGGDPGTGLGIAIGALLDGIPESAVLGLSMLGGQTVSIPVLTAIIISNLPEGLSSTAALKNSGRPARYVFALWGGIALVSALASIGGLLLLQDVPPETTSFVTAIAAGAILAMICDTMIPEAFQRTHAATGLLATGGFLLSFSIHLLP